MLPDLHTDFSRGRLGGLVFPSLSGFSTVYCDPHSQRLWHNYFRAFPSPPIRSFMLIATAAAKSLQSCATLCDTIDGSLPYQTPRPWDSPGKNAGVGCHFLLQCRKVKSESEVAQSCPTLSDPMDCSHQAPPSMGFSRQDYWSGVPLPSLLLP